jgi:hypothetical protein
MKKTTFVVSAVAAALMLVSVAGPSFGHTSSTQTKVRASKAPRGHVEAGTEVMVFGNLKSKSLECTQGQTVELFARGPGDDVSLDSDTTDAEGEFSLEVTAGEAKNVYVRYGGTTLTSYDHAHDCRRSKSRNLRIKVAKSDDD